MNRRNVTQLSVFWFRRDLRLNDNRALQHALNSGIPILPLFIFDEEITDELSADDARVSFIYKTLIEINKDLQEQGGSLLCLKGKPEVIWNELLSEYDISEVFVNRDYEPYAIARDLAIEKYLNARGVAFRQFKDQVIFEKDEILKNDGTPYTIFTPYKTKWLASYKLNMLTELENYSDRIYFRHNQGFPSLQSLGFQTSKIEIQSYDMTVLDGYERARDFPAAGNTSSLGPHLRFGTVSVRQIMKQLDASHTVFLSELIWREFFMQIMAHFPKVVTENFKAKYNGIVWRNNSQDFELWCNGQTGYPMVDAGMRQLNACGTMHNRVRMVVAGFLCKHLLIDWRWGEAYFAEKLLDYELSANNGNWQWAAGTGCDAAPYFRVFNPSEQLRRFDKDEIYVKRWVPEYGTPEYPQPMVEHRMARLRAIETYKRGLANDTGG